MQETQETQVQSLGPEDPLEKETAAHSSIFPKLHMMAQMMKSSACNAGDPRSIPGLGRSPGKGNGSLLQYSCLGNPMDRGAWRAAVYGVAKGQTQLSN